MKNARYIIDILVIMTIIAVLRRSQLLLIQVPLLNIQVI